MFIEAKDDGGGGDNWTTGAISRAKLQSNHHHQQTNTQFFTGRMPFLSPNQQCQSTEGKISHSMDLLTPSSPGGLPTLSLTTNSSWLPCGRVAMPLISPLKPVPQDSQLQREGCHASHQPSDASTPRLTITMEH